MVTTVFEILVTIVIVLFAILLANVVYYQRIISRSPVFRVACAGSEKPCTPKEYKVTNLQWNNFQKADGSFLDAREYRLFITVGESMLLGGIRNQDIIFVKESKELPTLPAILVLQREPMALAKAAQFNDKAEMKVRRSWKKCTLNLQNEDILDMVQEIINCKKFQEIRNRNEEKFPNAEWLIADFVVRLERYRKEHIGCEEDANVNHNAIISTTYDTQHGRVHFSIHSCNTIIGEVKYAFGINHDLEAA